MFGKVKAYRKNGAKFFGPPCIQSHYLFISARTQFSGGRIVKRFTAKKEEWIGLTRTTTRRRTTFVALAIGDPFAVSGSSNVDSKTPEAAIYKKAVLSQR